MKQKQIIILGIIFIIGIFLIILYVQQQKYKNEILTIEVTYSIGNGWTGWNEILTINNNGSVIFEEQQPFEGNKTIKSIQLSPKEINEFKKLVNDANVFDLQDNYDCEPNCPTDQSSSFVKFVINDKEKTISMYVPGEMPEKFEQILEKIGVLEQKIRLA